MVIQSHIPGAPVSSPGRSRTLPNCFDATGARISFFRFHFVCVKCKVGASPSNVLPTGEARAAKEVNSRQRDNLSFGNYGLPQKGTSFPHLRSSESPKPTDEATRSRHFHVPFCLTKTRGEAASSACGDATRGQRCWTGPSYPINKNVSGCVTSPTWRLAASATHRTHLFAR